MLVEPQKKLNFQKIILNSVSLDFSFVIVNFFYLHGDYGSGILNVFETNKHYLTQFKSLSGPNKTRHFGHLIIKDHRLVY